MSGQRKNKKNGPSINDIRKPSENHALNGRWFPKADFSKIHIPKSNRGIKIFAAIGALVVVLVIVGAGYLFLLRGEATQSTNILFEGLQNIVYGPFNQNVSSNDGQTNQNIIASQYGISILNTVPLFKDIPAGFNDMQKFAGLLIQTEVSLTELRSGGLSLFLGGNGTQLLAELNTIDSNFKNLNSIGNSIRNVVTEFNALNSNTAATYFATGTDLQRETDALDSLIALLKQPNSHILVLFEDTTIDRPGGGRISAYGDISIANGSLASFTINDINSLQNYDQKLVPPLQLQTVESSWKLRDSDWFFNFPASADELVSRIESADQAQGNPEQYSGVIAVSPQVVQDLVNVLGPIQLSNGKSVTAINFNTQLSQLGYIAFLNQLFSGVEQRAINFTTDEKINLLGVASNWIANRDVMAYFTDSKLETLINEYDLGGETYPTASGYVGDYLAVVHTDIGSGGKTQDSLSMHSSIDSYGTVNDDLSITRQNESNYINQEYFQVIVPSGSKLISVIGNTHNTVTPPIDYKQAGYGTDPEIVNIESSRTVDPDSLAESYNIPGNTVFGFWLTLLPGATGTVSVTYEPPQVNLQNGEGYQFVIERQPGENANLIYSVQAPQGWQWQQANDPMYLYSSDKLPGRTTLNITLVKNGS